MAHFASELTVRKNGIHADEKGMDREFSPRILIMLVASFASSANAEAGFWQTFTQRCASFFTPPRSGPERWVRLPEPVVKLPRPLNPVEIKRLQVEAMRLLRAGEIDSRFSVLISRIRYEAQFEVLRRVSKKSPGAQEVGWLVRTFDAVQLPTHALLFAHFSGNGFSASFDTRLIDSLFLVKTELQLRLFLGASLKVPLDSANYFRAFAIPRVSTETQYRALEMLMQHGRGADHDLVNLGLVLTNEDQLRGLEAALDAGLSYQTVESLREVTNAEKFVNFRKIIAAEAAPFDEVLPSPEKIAENRDPQFTLSLSGYSLLKEGPAETLLAVKFSDKAAIESTVFPGSVAFPLSEDRLFRERQMRDTRLRTKSQNHFVYSVFNREARRRSKFEETFIHYLKGEDQVLPYERIAMFEYKNGEGEVIGVFGLFDATPLPNFEDSTAPFLRKRPHLTDLFVRQTEAWRREFGTAPKIIEVRRLALHPNASQLDVEAVVRTISAYLRRMGFADSTVIIAHTDHAGSLIFQRKAKMHLLYAPETVAADEYVLFAKVGTDWKDI